jgi:hypothetical protein
MDGLEFRKRGREMVDYMVDYLDNIDARRVTPNIEPGYLQDLIPEDPPENPENWETIMDDVEKKIMVGVREAFSSVYDNVQFRVELLVQVFSTLKKNFLI